MSKKMNGREAMAKFKITHHRTKKYKKSKMARGKGGSANNNRNKGKKDPNFRHNPKRGPPGILLFCETGRERKCLNEAMEILNHYYYSIDNKNGGGSSSGNGSEGGVDDNGKAEKVMTLEEEIAMLKQQKKKAPFHVYETGCKGAVFIMCTLEDSNLVSVPKSSPPPSTLSPSVTDDTAIGKGHIREEDNTENATTKRKLHDKCDKDNSTSTNHKKQKTENTAVTTTESKKVNSDQGGVIDGADDNQETAIENSSTATKLKWDPIQTVQSIIQDIRNNESTAPRSRFIARMIPIQATCFANMEEITSTATALIRKFLMPHGIQSYSDGRSAGESKSNDNEEGGTGHNSEDQREKLPTFKIEFRRRFCAHLKRDGVIEIIAGAVQSLTAEYWNGKKVGVPAKMNEETAEKVQETANSSSKEEVEKDGDRDCNTQGNSTDEKHDHTQLFAVDLKNPDYTIIVEVCRTLCTMSIVKGGAQSYRNFNLTKIQEDVD